MGQISYLLCQIVCFPIFVYQKIIRPVMKPCCRFHPSCSDYALSAIQQHGVVVGLKWTVWRVLRCHPWSQGGCDPVVPKKNTSNT